MKLRYNPAMTSCPKSELTLRNARMHLGRFSRVMNFNVETRGKNKESRTVHNWSSRPDFADEFRTCSRASVHLVDGERVVSDRYTSATRRDQFAFRGARAKDRKNAQSRWTLINIQNHREMNGDRVANSAASASIAINANYRYIMHGNSALLFFPLFLLLPKTCPRTRRGSSSHES